MRTVNKIIATIQLYSIVILLYSVANVFHLLSYVLPVITRRNLMLLSTIVFIATICLPR
jgi:hypothetical protein